MESKKLRISGAMAESRVNVCVRWPGCYLPPYLFIPVNDTNSFLQHLVFNYMFYHGFAPTASCFSKPVCALCHSEVITQLHHIIK